MFDFTLNGKDYSIPTKHNEITLEFYFGIYQIVEKYTDIVEKSEEEVDYKESLKMYADIFQYMTGVDDNTLKNTNIEQIMLLVDNIQDLLKNYDCKGNVDHFEIEGDKYMFPKQMMMGNTYGEFIEASQLELNIKYLKNGKFDVLPEQMAILCRKPGEDFDESFVVERTKLFTKKVTMDIVFEYAFFLQQRIDTLIKSFQISKEAVSQLQSQSHKA